MGGRNRKKKKDGWAKSLNRVRMNRARESRQKGGPCVVLYDRDKGLGVLPDRLR